MACDGRDVGVLGVATDLNDVCFDGLRIDELGLEDAVAAGLSTGLLDLEEDDSAQMTAPILISDFPEMVSWRWRTCGGMFTAVGTGGNSSSGEDDFARDFSTGGALMVCTFEREGEGEGESRRSLGRSVGGSSVGTAFRMMDVRRPEGRTFSGTLNSLGVVRPREDASS